MGTKIEHPIGYSLAQVRVRNDRIWDRVWDRVRVQVWVREMVEVTVGVMVEIRIWVRVIFFDGKIKTENGILF